MSFLNHLRAFGPTRYGRTPHNQYGWRHLLQTRIHPKLWWQQLWCRHKFDTQSTSSICPHCQRVRTRGDDGRVRHYVVWPHGQFLPWERR